MIVYPTGGGTGLIGMWKAFDEMEQLGWIGPRRPRMVAVQAEGCAPIVQAFEAGLDHAPTFENAKTRAAGIRVPKALGDFLILRALRESGGLAVSVSDEEMVAAARELFRREGIFTGYEGAAAVATLAKLAERGDIGRDDRVVVFNTGSGYKSPEIVAGAGRRRWTPGRAGGVIRVGSFQEVEALLSRRERDGGRPGAGSGTAGSDPLHVPPAWTMRPRGREPWIVRRSWSLITWTARRCAGLPPFAVSCHFPSRTATSPRLRRCCARRTPSSCATRRWSTRRSCGPRRAYG